MPINKRRRGLMTLGLFLGLSVLLHTALFWNARGGIWTVIWNNLPQASDLPISVLDAHVATNRIELPFPEAQPLAQISPEFLSFSFDSAQLVGAPWWRSGNTESETGAGSFVAPPIDLEQPELQFLARSLAPAWLRIGGTAADQLYYHLDDSVPLPNPLPAGYTAVLQKSHWLGLESFIKNTGLKLAFTINAGAGPRGGSMNQAWTPNNAAQLFNFVAQRPLAVDLYEFGNELNAYLFLRGLGQTVAVDQYLRDYKTLCTLQRAMDPQAMSAAQGSAYWPVLGEPLAWLNGYSTAIMQLGPQWNDRLLLHYYPQQSSRAPIATVRASPGRLFDADRLDELAYWLQQFKTLRASYSPTTPIWIGETGHAQAGGEPAVSSSYLSSVWWLDQLGLAAAEGVEVVVRQTLLGSDYGLIDDTTLQPRPDWWASWLWKGIMGSHVHGFKTFVSKQLRAYVHFDVQQKAWTILCINIDTKNSLSIGVPFSTPGQAWYMGSPAVQSSAFFINGQLATIDRIAAGVNALAEPCAQSLMLPPLGMVFARYPAH